jgi:hypothetical protein
MDRDPYLAAFVASSRKVMAIASTYNLFFLVVTRKKKPTRMAKKPG